MTKAVLDIAIGLVFYQGQVLVGWRTSDQHQGNKYEFPGGKVESGETALAACRREVFEEVGVDIVVWHPFDVVTHDYDDLKLNLHIFHAQLDASALLQVKTPWSWYTRAQLQRLEFPAANKNMIARLNWPTQIKISEDIDALAQLGADQALYWRIAAAQLNETVLQDFDASQLAGLIVNIEIYNLLSPQHRQHITAVHFKQHQLMALKIGDLPLGQRCIAACHDLAAIQQAQAVGFDAVLLSPVQATASHPEAIGMGWQAFQQIAQQCHIPIFALGGLKPNDLDLAQRHGAYGVAGISGF